MLDEIQINPDDERSFEELLISELKPFGMDQSSSQQTKEAMELECVKKELRELYNLMSMEAKLIQHLNEEEFSKLFDERKQDHEFLHSNDRFPELLATIARAHQISTGFLLLSKSFILPVF